MITLPSAWRRPLVGLVAAWLLLATLYFQTGAAMVEIDGSRTLFDTRRYIEFPLEQDQFFPMGDNSPQSKDGRLWGEPAYVERELLTGKAVLVYWPHSWNEPPMLPNFKQMRLIR